VARGDSILLRIRAVVVAAVAAGALVLLASPATAQQGGPTTTTEADDGGGQVVVTTDPDAPAHGVTGILAYNTGSPPDVERVLVEGVTVTVTGPGGEEVGEAESDEEGSFLIEVPGPGVYTVSIDTETLPDGVELKNPDGGDTNDVTVDPREVQRVLFGLQEEGAEASGGGTSDWQRFKQLLVEGVKFGLVIAMMAVGLSLIFGTTGLTNFAHGELVALGAVVVWYLNDWGLWLPWSVLIGLVLMFGFGAGFDRVVWRPLRHRGTSLIAMLVISIGLSLLIRYLILYVFGGRPRSYHDFQVQKPWHVLSITIVPRDVIVIVLSLIVLTGVGLVLTRTRIGKAIRAVADNPDLARSSGIDVDRVILVVWGAGAALATLGGVFFGMSDLVDWAFGFKLLLLMFAGVTLGGLGTAFGAFVGSLLVGIIIQVSTLWISPELKNVIALALLILILVVRPQGIFGRRERIG
jgi:branched-chain amino acid transport system permease protein